MKTLSAHAARSATPTRAARTSVLRSASRRSTRSVRSSTRRSSPAPALALASAPALALAPALASAPAPAPALALASSLQPLVVACARLATGYDLCARRARDIRVADVAGSLSTLYRAVTDELAAFLAAFGASVPRTKSTCSERLRWEWLASTGRLMDGSPERQVVLECLRIEDGVAAHVVALCDRLRRLDADPDLDLEPLRQIATLLERARAASVRLGGRARTPAAAFATG